MIKTIEDRKQKWVDFLSGDVNVKTMFLIDTDETAEKYGPRPLPWPGLINERVGWAYNDYSVQLSNAEWLHDDRVPALSPYTGTEIFAEALGCKVHYPDNNMPFALAKYSTIAEAAELKVPDVHSTPLDNLFEIARRLLQKAGCNAVVQLPDIQSPFDIAALLVNKEEFYVSLIEDPPAVREIIYKTKSLLTSFLDDWFSEFGTSYIAHFPTYYMEGGITLSEDEIGAFNTAAFKEYVFDTLNELSGRYGGIGIHCCAASEHQWGFLKDVKGLRLINLVKDTGLIKKSLKYFGNSITHWPMDGSPVCAEEPAWLKDCPKNVGAVLTYKAQNKLEAMEIAKRAEVIRQ